MTALPIAAGSRLRALSSDWIACHPEWWLLAAGVGGWLILLLAPADELFPLCTSAVFVAGRPLFSGAWSAAAWLPPTGNLAEWVLMTIAMMAPLVVLPVRHVAFRSFRDRRHLAIGEFLIGYFGVWIGFGAALLPTLAMLQSVGLGGRIVIAAAGYLVAAAWQLTPSKRAALWRCHRAVPLAPDGWLADANQPRRHLGILATMASFRRGRDASVAAPCADPGEPPRGWP